MYHRTDSSDYFAYVDNFMKNSHIKSIKIGGELTHHIPLVSIMIPTYKRPNLLKDAIQSAVNQINFENYEIIVVDNDCDGIFSDQILQIIREINSSKIVYYRNESNLGMFGNWNRCIELANSEWMLILSDDDLLANNYLYKMYPVTKLPGVSRIECGCIDFRQQSDILLTHSSNLVKIKRYIKNKIREFFNKSVNCNELKVFPVSMIRYSLANRSLAMHANLFKRDKAKSIGGFNPEYFPFADFCFNVSYHYYYQNCYKINEELVYYRWLDNESLNPRTVLLQIIGFRKFSRYLIHFQKFKLLFKLCANFTFSQAYLVNFYKNKKISNNILFRKIYALLNLIIM